MSLKIITLRLHPYHLGTNGFSKNICTHPTVGYNRATGEHNVIEAEWRIYASVIQPSLVQTMTCRLAGAKSLPETMLEYR